MMAHGEKHGRAKLSLWEICAIRALFLHPMPPPMARVARAFGITPAHVRRIINRTQRAKG
jgi:hypothetical protein